MTLGAMATAASADAAKLPTSMPKLLLANDSATSTAKNVASFPGAGLSPHMV